MNYETTSIQLDDFLRDNKSVYIRLQPDIADFTKKTFSGSLIVVGKKTQVSIPFSHNNLGTFVGMLNNTIFSSDYVERIYCWDIKSFNSFCLYHLGRTPNIQIPVFDLQVIENFVGLNSPAPSNIQEFGLRIQTAMRMSDWGNAYKQVHMPLMMEVIPAIETFSVLHAGLRQEVHPYYQIEGQQNGRLNSVKAFHRGYLPHNMGPELRKNLMPLGERKRFLLADFRHCEVTMLQWLSKCDVLKAIIDSGDDVHEKIYEKITNQSCDDENKRNKSKIIFLPVIYGCGPSTLAKNLKLPVEIGKEIIRRIHSLFPTPIKWAREQENLAKQGTFKDHFGRVRKLTPKEAWKARNTAVQGPSATFCAEKLIKLHRDMEYGKLAFSVHDGYGVVCDIPKAKSNYVEVKKILESESELCPGLKMKVQIKFGSTLGDARVLLGG